MFKIIEANTKEELEEKVHEFVDDWSGNDEDHGFSFGSVGRDGRGYWVSIIMFDGSK